MWQISLVDSGDGIRKLQVKTSWDADVTLSRDALECQRQLRVVMIPSSTLFARFYQHRFITTFHKTWPLKRALLALVLCVRPRVKIFVAFIRANTSRKHSVSIDAILNHVYLFIFVCLLHVIFVLVITIMTTTNIFGILLE